MVTQILYQPLFWLQKLKKDDFSSAEEEKYQLMKCNVDQLKIIQLGITVFDFSGNLPKGNWFFLSFLNFVYFSSNFAILVYIFMYTSGVCTWQFNFKFNVMEDTYAEDSINLLKR